MVTARDVMHAGVQSVRHDETLLTAATMMAQLHVGALPVVTDGDQVQGIITDRDIVVRGLAAGHEPRTTTTAALIHGVPVSVEASADVRDVLRAMEKNEVRRVMVVDGGRLVGIISEADLATHLGDAQIGEFTASVYSAPPNN